jgi:DnaK suppressor protein
MREGQYGACEGCGTNIPMARLNALPYATYCINCQREAERQGAASPADVDWSRLLDTPTGDAELSLRDVELDVS